MTMTTTTSIHVQLGTAFWLLLFVIIAGIVMWTKLGSEKMGKVLEGWEVKSLRKRAQATTLCLPCEKPRLVHNPVLQLNS